MIELTDELVQIVYRYQFKITPDELLNLAKMYDDIVIVDREGEYLLVIVHIVDKLWGEY